jgi:hypothetical protein
MDQQTVKPRSPEWLPIWEIVAICIGDVITLIIFAFTGRLNHGIETSNGPILGAINTAFPFIIGWLFIGGILGAFSGKSMFPLKRVLVRTFGIALITGPISVILYYALRTVDQGFAFFSIEWTFLIIATLSTSTMLLVWRVIWSRFRRLWWSELP